MRFSSFFKPAALPLMAVLAIPAQMAPVVTIAPPPLVKAKRGTTVPISVKVTIPAGFHANSATPSEPNLIPLTLKWTGGPLQAGQITYPKPSMEQYGFTAGKAISVVTGTFEIATKFTIPTTAVLGPAAETGTLRYQSCNDRMCFPPKTLPVNVSLAVE